METGKCLETIKNKKIGALLPHYPDFIGIKLKYENKRIKFPFTNKIKITDIKTGETLQTFINIPGLLIQGCSFQNLHRKSNLTDEDKELLKMYGGEL